MAMIENCVKLCFSLQQQTLVQNQKLLIKILNCGLRLQLGLQDKYLEFRVSTTSTQ